MKKINLPGFTGEGSLHRRRGSYQSQSPQYSSGEQGVISQIRVSGGGIIWGGRPILGGFWSCALCTAACTILTGGELAACLVACNSSGACD
jgi:hypothetical protein